MPEETLFTVVRGRPAEAELAAVTAVLLLCLRGDRDAEPDEPPARADWSTGQGRYRPPVTWSRP